MMINLLPFQPFLKPLKWVLIVGAIFFGGLKIKTAILNLPFVTKDEYARTLKTLEKNQRIIDSLYAQVAKRDSIVAEYKNKRIVIESNRLKNKKLLKNARGNILALDSIANGIL